MSYILVTHGGTSAEWRQAEGGNDAGAIYLRPVGRHHHAVQARVVALANVAHFDPAAVTGIALGGESERTALGICDGFGQFVGKNVRDVIERVAVGGPGEMHVLPIVAAHCKFAPSAAFRIHARRKEHGERYWLPGNPSGAGTALESLAALNSLKISSSVNELGGSEVLERVP